MTVKKKKEEFSKYITNVLKNSMLTGIPQIASAKNWPLRITRLVVFIVCLGGFIYQSSVFMNLYWQYDVVMDLFVENPEEVQWPAVTVCVDIGLKQQEICKHEGEDWMEAFMDKYDFTCFKYEVMYPDNRTFCSCSKRFCDEFGRSRKLKEIDTINLFHVPFDEIKQWFVTEKEFVHSCRKIRTPEDRTTLFTTQGCKKRDSHIINYPLYDGITQTIHFCVTINSLIGRPNYTIESVLPSAEMRFFLNQSADNYPSTISAPLMAVSIHNPYTIKNPFSEGFILEPYRTFRMRLKKVIKKRLPPPYKTNCRDYLADWYANGGSGPVDYKDCRIECQVNESIAAHGCLLPTITAVRDVKRCLDRYRELAPPNYTECVKKNCRPPCYEEEYEVEQISWPYQRVNCLEAGYITLVSSLSYEYAVNLEIDLNGMETTTHIYSPKYNVIETFSYVGGYVGMWLGISLVAVFDFLETLVVMLKYPIRKCARFRERRRKINEIQKFQRKL